MEKLPELKIFSLIYRSESVRLIFYFASIIHLSLLQAEEGRAGTEDVVVAGEQEGADGAAGGLDEAAQGDAPLHSGFLQAAH